VYDHELNAAGLTLAEASLLAHLAASGELMQVDLARQLRTSKARVGVYIDQLEVRGAVQRRPDPADRRVWRIRLTDVGRALWERSVEIDRDVRRSLRVGTSAAERAVLDAVLLRIERNARRLLDG
jgi:MarR family transcriptional regulator for hemolysin